MSLAQQPDDLKVTALNAAIRSLVAPLQLLGRVMWSEKNSTGHADDVATANGHNTPQSISLAIFLQITKAKASIRKAYQSSLDCGWRCRRPAQAVLSAFGASCVAGRHLTTTGCIKRRRSGPAARPHAAHG